MTDIHAHADPIAAANADAAASRLAMLLRCFRNDAVKAEDVSAFRMIFETEGFASRDEAEVLFRIERASLLKDDAWTGFFIETITDHIVWETRPTGRLNESEAEWLLDQCDRTATLASFGVLVNVLAETDRVPLWFLAAVRARAARKEYALDEACQAAAIRPLQLAA